MFLHRVNNTEYDIKQNIYTGMEHGGNLFYTSMILYIKTVILKNDASSELTNFQSDLFFKEHY